MDPYLITLNGKFEVFHVHLYLKSIKNRSKKSGLPITLSIIGNSLHIALQG